MSFRIVASADAGIPLLQLRDESNQTTVSIVPGSGAMLHALTVPVAGVLHNIIDGYRDAADMATHLDKSYKSSKLSPFPCRIDGGTYHFGGHSYQFPELFGDGNAIHGLLFNKPFNTVAQTVTDTHASVQFEYEYRAENPGYPFSYRCGISYTLFPGRVLQLQTTVKNTGTEALPIGDGWHPYFALGGKVDDWQLRFHCKGMLEFSETLIPTGALLPFEDFASARAIGNRELDNCFPLEDGASAEVCQLTHPVNGLSVSFHTDGNYPFLQLYIPPHRESIAIENLSMAPNAFNNGMGLLVLQPGEEKSFNLHYQVNTAQTA